MHMAILAKLTEWFFCKNIRFSRTEISVISVYTEINASGLFSNRYAKPYVIDFTVKFMLCE